MTVISHQLNKLPAAVTQCLGTPPIKHDHPPGDLRTQTLRQLTTLQAVAKMMLDLVEVESMSAGSPLFPRPRGPSQSATFPPSSSTALASSSHKPATKGTAPASGEQSDQPALSRHAHNLARSTPSKQQQQQQQWSSAPVQDHLHASLVALAALEWVLEQHTKLDATQPAGLMSEGLLAETVWSLLELLHDLLVPHLADLSLDMSSVCCLGSSVLLRCTRYTLHVVDELQLRAILEPFLARLATCKIAPSQLVSASSLFGAAWESGLGSGEH